MKAELMLLIDGLSESDEERAWKALEGLEVALTPQGLVFEEDSPECIPLMLELALEETTVIQADLMRYLGEAYRSAVWTWRRVRDEDDAERRHVYDEKVAWEESVSASYEAALPRVLALARLAEDIRLRGACVLLLGGAVDQGEVLVPVLQEFYGQVGEEPLKIDVIEAVANLGIGPRSDEVMRPAVAEWLRLGLADPAAGVRLGTALSLLARVGAEEHGMLREAVVDSVYQGTPALESAMWMFGRPFGWALDRRLRR